MISGPVEASTHFEAQGFGGNGCNNKNENKNGETNTAAKKEETNEGNKTVNINKAQMAKQKTRTILT